MKFMFGGNRRKTLLATIFGLISLACL